MAVVAGVLSLVALAIFGYYPRQLQEATRQATEDRARGLANTVAIGVAVGLEVFELEAISAAFDFARSDPDFAAIAVRDTDGVLVGAYGEIDAIASDPGYLRVTMPVTYRSDALGEVELWMSLDRMNITVAAQRRAGLLICSGVFGVGILLTLIGARPITRPLAQLAAAAGELSVGHLDAPLPPPGRSEVGRLAAAFDHMRREVRDSLRRLREQSAEMRLMLDHLEEGLFTFNTDLSINPQCSRRTGEILGVEDVPAAAWQELLPVDAETLDAFRRWVRLMADVRDPRNFGPFGRLNPIEEFSRETPPGRRYIRIICRPILQDARVTRFLVLVMDVTDQRRAQQAVDRKEREQKCDSERVLALIAGDRREIEDLLGRCDAVTQATAAERGTARESDALGWLRREVHTLKGNSGSFGFSELSTALGEAETALYTTRDGVGAARSAQPLEPAFEPVRAELRRIESWRTKLLAESADRVDVDQATYVALIRELEESRDPGHAGLVDRVRYLSARPLAHYGRRYQRFLERYRAASGKGIADLEVLTPNALILPETMGVLDECIVQLLRNAADHGIESNADREAAGKRPGRISLAARRVADGLEVTVSDDGGGIDRDAVTQAAIAAGVVQPREAAKLSTEAIMSLAMRRGVTTRSEAGDISGRGVGLDVVVAAMRRAAGDVTIRTQAGRGSQVTLRLPVPGRVITAVRGEGTWLES